MDNVQQKIIKFSEIKNDLVIALNEKLKSNKLHITEKVTIIDGFVNQPLSMELSGSFVIGGPTIPMIMLIGDESGRIYYFALKAILPNKIEI
jgi:hypothetical protein